MSGRPHLSTVRRSGARSSTTVATFACLTLLLSACSGGPVALATPDLGGADLAACEAFTADLPPSIFEQPAREVEPTDAFGGAYGDPAIIVRCGVPVPDDFDEATSSCEVANGVGWYVPPEQFDDQGADVTLTAAGYRPVVQVTVPATYRPDGTAAAIAQLAAAVDEDLVLVENCN